MFTCGEDNHWFDWANRSQEQDVNITTRGLVRPLLCSTWTALNGKSPRVSPVTNYAGGGHFMSPPEPSTRSTSNCLPPLPQLYSPPALSLYLFLCFTPCLLRPSHPILPTQQHSPLLLWWIPYSTPSPPFPIPLSTPPFLLTTFASRALFQSPPSPTHTASRLRMTGNYN